MIVKLSNKAEHDLAEIGDYIAPDNPLRAVNFIDELQARCLTLDRHPERFPIVGRQDAYQARKDDAYRNTLFCTSSRRTGSMSFASYTGRALGWI